MRKLILILPLLALTLKPAEWKPEYYHICQDGQTAQMRHALKEVHKLKLKGSESVLDVGCGDGKISAAIAKQWLPKGTMHGIDISKSMIYAAQQNKFNNISFEEACIFSYQPQQLFDAVVCFWVLYLLPNYQEALDKILSFLKPGGKALICHIVHPGPPFSQLFSKFVPQAAVKFPAAEAVMKAALNANAKLEYFELKYNYDHYPDLNTLFEKCKKVPLFSQLSKEKEQQFFQELSTAYTLESDGSVYDYGQVVCMVLEKN